MPKELTYWDQEGFATPYQMGSQKHRIYLLDLLRELNVNSLLDVGCGTGPIYDLIANNEEGRWDNILAYKGTDYSWRMIDTCKQQFPHGEFEVQDARDMKEEDSSWDCVLLMHCLDHLDDYKAAIKEATRVSKKYVLIVLWRSFAYVDTLNPKNMMGKQEGEEPWKDTYLHDYKQEDLEDCFAENNLIIDRVAQGEQINSDYSKYNFLYMLRKDTNA